jgi:BirA family biotin operon repressor/biotin-[acetyl-CoA-carboxylase] ligase
MPPTAVADPAAAPGPALRAALTAPLRPALIAAAAGLDPGCVEAVLQTGSTNADLLARARAHAAGAPCLRAALEQTAGRGRLGRRWHATPGSALLFSLALPLDGLRAPTAATLVAGVALAETLGSVLADAGLDLRLKWPNDLLLEGRKLGGVLAELAVDRAGRQTLVIGIGINLWLDAAALGSIGQPAAALAERVSLDSLAAQRERLIGRAAAAVRAAVADCAQRGFVPYQARFMQRFASLGQSVVVIEHGARVAEGRALGVDGEGRLLLDRAGRVLAFASGEISVRAGAGGAAEPASAARRAPPASGGGA